MSLRLLCCCLGLAAVLSAGDAPLEPVLARWNAAVVKAAQACSAAVEKVDANVLREAERAAVAAARRNDMAAAIAAWCEALRVDRDHPKACEALNALGRLEELRAAVDGEADATLDLLAGGAPQSDDPGLRRDIERRLKVLREETAKRGDAWNRADATALPDLERLATRATAKGDLDAVRAAWYEVLRLARDHAKAREFFTALGQLDVVLAELDLLGDPRQAAAGSGNLRGIAAGFVFQPRNIASQGGRWLVKDMAGGKPAVISAMAAAPTQPWLTCDGNMTVEVPDATVVRVLPFTVACWYRPQQGSAGLVGDYVGGSWNGFMLHLEGPSVAAWMLRSHGNEVSICNELNGLRVVAWRANEWQHAAVSVDEKELALYADGKLAMRQPWRGQSGPTTQTGPLLIGHYNGSYRGDISSVLFWRRTLSPAEVATVAAETAPKR
jgi:hypothetical protein